MGAVCLCGLWPLQRTTAATEGARSASVPGAAARAALASAVGCARSRASPLKRVLFLALTQPAGPPPPLFPSRTPRFPPQWGFHRMSAVDANRSSTAAALGGVRSLRPAGAPSAAARRADSAAAHRWAGVPCRRDLGRNRGIPLSFVRASVSWWIAGARFSTASGATCSATRQGADESC